MNIEHWIRILLCPLLLVASAGWSNPTTEAAAANRGEVGRYQIRLAEDLRSVLVRVQLAAGVNSLSAVDGNINNLQDLKDCQDQPVRLRGDRIAADSAGQCLSYRYPLSERQGRRSPPAAAGVVVSSPGEWLWTPRLADDARLRLELSVPDDVAVSVPWRPLAPGVFELSASPGSSTGSAVFGRFEEQVLNVAGARLRVALVDGPGTTLDSSTLMAWLEAAAADVAGVGGRFPNPDLQVVVQPATRSGRSPVPFGFVIRDGGEAVRFFVDPGRPLEDYLGDWTATHEFSHLLLPYVRSRQKWISEGFASYYQNVLLARSGEYSEEEAWNRLHRAFTQAAAIDNPPQLNRIGDRPFWEMRMLIYWSGAAMALLADARLRELSGGQESLDTALGELAACCLPSGDTWSGERLFARLDELSTHPVFTPLYDELSSRRGMPELSALYTDLGLKVDGKRVRLLDEGRLVNIRRSIMQQSAGVDTGGNGGEL